MTLFKVVITIIFIVYLLSVMIGVDAAIVRGIGILLNIWFVGAILYAKMDDNC